MTCISAAALSEGAKTLHSVWRGDAAYSLALAHLILTNDLQLINKMATLPDEFVSSDIVSN